MKKISIILGAIVASMILLSMNRTSTSTIQELPSVGLQSKFESKLTGIKTFGKEFHQTIEEGSRAVIVSQFLQLRLKFKEVEFLIAYTDPQLFNVSLNGAPLPKLMKKVPDLTIIDPKGLQRMEEVIFDDDFDREEVLSLFEKFQYSLDQFMLSMKNRKLTDAEFFEAVRYGLIRLNTLNVTGFDAPVNSDKVHAECVSIMQGMKWVLADYASFVKSSKLNGINAKFDTGIDQLKRESFESFDHLSFLVDVINPLWKSTLELQRELNIELPSQRYNYPRHLNYQADNLFASDFLNASTFGEFQEGEDLALQIELGEKLFFDPILSRNNSMSCASCHSPSKAFTDGKKTSLTINGEPGKRNSPTLMNALYATRYFHDVRVDRLSLQMDHVVYNDDEFGTNYDEIAAKLRASEEYRKTFSKAYKSEKITKHAITNAMSKYVSSLRSFNSEFDRYVRGEISTISDEVKRGYNLFQGKAACATCHFAPTFAGTVPPFYNETETEVLGVPAQKTEPYSLDEDLGRYENKIITEKADFYKNSFKTPTLRNIELTGPYMHNGVYETLEEVIDFYNDGGGIGLGLNVPHQTLPGDSLELRDDEKADLIEFLKALTDNPFVQLDKGKINQ